MEQGIVTGKGIHSRLSALYAEISEISAACVMVSDAVGQSSVAYEVLLKTLKAKQQELRKLEGQPYYSASHDNTIRGSD